MKPVSTALAALLTTRQFFAADLYTFTLAGGALLRYCGGDSDIVSGGNLFTAGGQTGPYFDDQKNKCTCHWKVGVEVDTLVFDVMPGAASVLGMSFLSAVRSGLFDGAELQLERAFMPSYGNTAAGTVILFVGRVAEIDAGRSLATFSVNSHLELLNQNLPRNLYQPSCINTLGDYTCTVNLAALTVSGSTAAGSSTSIILSALTQASDYFDQGVVTFISGINDGLARTVKTWTAGSPGSLALIAPFPNPPATGDAFTVYPGCDKTTGPQGCPKFDNLAHFRGFPFIPVPETAV